MYTDTHCHLNIDVFDNDREEVLERARENGIDRILVPGIDIASSRYSITLADTYTDVFAAVGIHPNSAGTWNTHSLIDLQELATHPKVVAIGEIGLDYYRDRAPRQQQINIFQIQLDLAASVGLPVVIHNRQASAELFRIIHLWCVNLHKMENAIWKNPGVLHSFSENELMARQGIADNFMIGVTGPITYHNARVVQKMATDITIEHLLIETDAPFLPPHPYRGTRNEPAHVRLVADKIAQLKGIDVDIIERQTTINADNLFRWREPVD